ncbi:prolyl aminopeptidase [Flagellatimonas centrodinii]|nr:prolyl aminopeptidase [Flagellatimonas centrodinii]ULQ48179.1 prolyl aminopeptidase [Flagellatimonas centrodinii]
MPSALPQLFPPIEAHATYQLPVSPLHTLYVEESGNPDGQPVIFVHGGPGGGCEPWYRQFFDPRRYRIVLFDQRGCGRSTPHAELRENTTWDLVADMERIRQHLSIERWVVFGGSWGSTLALTYAQAHGDRVIGLILRGIFLLRRAEIEWFYQSGASWLYPDAWQAYLQHIPVEERHDMVAAYYRRLTSADVAVRRAAARVWSLWEGATSKLIPSAAATRRFGEDRFAEAFARIECHYFQHAGFFERDDQLLANAYRLHAIPGVIVQGRYDVVCPMRSAWELHQAWPQAEFHIIADAGHAASEPGTLAALLSATQRFSSLP